MLKETEIDTVENGTILSNGAASVHSPRSESTESSASSTARKMKLTENSPLLSFKEKRKQKKVNQFYDEQVRLLTAYHCDIDRLNSIYPKGTEDHSEVEKKQRKRDELLAKMVLVLNFTLLVGKCVAAAMSNSLAIITTVIESAVDLVSGIVIWITSTAITHSNPYEYPRGRSKLEPLAVIFVSIIMGVANIQVIIQAITQLAEQKVSLL